MPPLLLRSPFPPEECRIRLEAAAEPDIPIVADLKLSYGVIAHAQGGTVWLRVRRSLINNLVSPWLQVRCRPSLSGSGSLIDVRIRYEPLAIAFMILSLSFIGLAGGAFFVVSIRDMLAGRRTTEDSVWLGLLVSPLVLAFGMICIWLGRRDQHAMIRLVERTLDAVPFDPRAA